MSYVVLARKWRPQQFDDVVGQGHVARTLCNAMTAGRIAHEAGIDHYRHHAAQIRRWREQR